METTTESGIIHNKPSVESWILSGVSYRGKTGTYDVIGEMTPSMAQDKLIEKYGLEIPSTDLVWAIATRGHDLRNENPEASEKLRQFLRQGFRRYPNTSTRLIYNPQGEKDEVIHNYKTSKKYSLKRKIVGPDGLLKDIPDKKVLESLLGTSDVSRIYNVCLLYTSPSPRD